MLNPVYQVLFVNCYLNIRTGNIRQGKFSDTGNVCESCCVRCMCRSFPLYSSKPLKRLPPTRAMPDRWALSESYLPTFQLVALRGLISFPLCLIHWVVLPKTQVIQSVPLVKPSNREQSLTLPPVPGTSFFVSPFHSGELGNASLYGYTAIQLSPLPVTAWFNTPLSPPIRSYFSVCLHRLVNCN